MGAVTLIGAALSAASAIAAGRAQAASAGFSADMAQQQATRERDIAAADAREHRRAGRRQLATDRARRAGRGITTEGTPLLVDAATAADIELGAQDILSRGAARAQRHRQQSALTRSRARATRAAAYRRAGRTLLTSHGWGEGGGGIRL